MMDRPVLSRDHESSQLAAAIHLGGKFQIVGTTFWVVDGPGVSEDARASLPSNRLSPPPSTYLWYLRSSIQLDLRPRTVHSHSYCAVGSVATDHVSNGNGGSIDIIPAPGSMSKLQPKTLCPHGLKRSVKRCGSGVRLPLRIRRLERSCRKIPRSHGPSRFGSASNAAGSRCAQRLATCLPEAVREAAPRSVSRHSSRHLSPTLPSIRRIVASTRAALS